MTEGDGESAPRPAGKGAKARGARTRGRIFALQMVYSFEQNRYQSGVNLVPEDDFADLEPEAKTARLVNGVLDRIARDHRADEVAPRADAKGPRPEVPPIPLA